MRHLKVLWAKPGSNSQKLESSNGQKPEWMADAALTSKTQTCQGGSETKWWLKTGAAQLDATMWTEGGSRQDRQEIWTWMSHPQIQVLRMRHWSFCELTQVPNLTSFEWMPDAALTSKTQTSQGVYVPGGVRRLSGDRKLYLPNSIPQCGIEGGSRQDGQGEAGGRRNQPPKMHRGANSHPMEALPPPLVRRDTQPRHIGSRANQLRDLLVHSQPRYQVRHPILVRQRGVAEGEQQQARVS